MWGGEGGTWGPSSLRSLLDQRQAQLKLANSTQTSLSNTRDQRPKFGKPHDHTSLPGLSGIPEWVRDRGHEMNDTTMKQNERATRKRGRLSERSATARQKARQPVMGTPGPVPVTPGLVPEFMDWSCGQGPEFGVTAGEGWSGHTGPRAPGPYTPQLRPTTHTRTLQNKSGATR